MEVKGSCGTPSTSMVRQTIEDTSLGAASWKQALTKLGEGPEAGGRRDFGGTEQGRPGQEAPEARLHWRKGGKGGVSELRVRGAPANIPQTGLAPRGTPCHSDMRGPISMTTTWWH